MVANLPAMYVKKQVATEISTVLSVPGFVLTLLQKDNSLFGHHDNPFFQPLINDYVEVFSEDCPIAQLSFSRKLITMATKLFASDSHTSTYEFDLVLHNL